MSKQPKDVPWDLDMFGSGQLVFHLGWNVPWYRRLITRVLFGSRWRLRQPVPVPVPEPEDPVHEGQG
jgi:hypothetical protein